MELLLGVEGARGGGDPPWAGGGSHGAMVLIDHRNRCACNEQSLVFDPFKSFDQIGSRHKSDFFFSK